MKSYFVYMLLCADRSFYIGITNDPDVRVPQHQEGHDPRSYTFTRRPVKLVHCSEFHDVAGAIAWEKQLKGWSRAKKVAFISGNFALVHELAKRTQR
ncbi:MAG TPA: GIY-YIG nuclease family protein [Candidatus Binatia bacterium]|nr:GIY-YIG nuclease family protein [Candidatus Binatia bacterium]